MSLERLLEQNKTNDNDSDDEQPSPLSLAKRPRLEHDILLDYSRKTLPLQTREPKQHQQRPPLHLATISNLVAERLRVVNELTRYRHSDNVRNSKRLKTRLKLSVNILQMGQESSAPSPRSILESISRQIEALHRTPYSTEGLCTIKGLYELASHTPTVISVDADDYTILEDGKSIQVDIVYMPEIKTLFTKTERGDGNYANHPTEMADVRGTYYPGDKVLDLRVYDDIILRFKVAEASFVTPLYRGKLVRDNESVGSPCIVEVENAIIPPYSEITNNVKGDERGFVGVIQLHNRVERKNTGGVSSSNTMTGVKFDQKGELKKLSETENATVANLKKFLALSREGLEVVRKSNPVATGSTALSGNLMPSLSVPVIGNVSSINIKDLPSMELHISPAVKGLGRFSFDVVDGILFVPTLHYITTHQPVKNTDLSDVVKSVLASITEGNGIGNVMASAPNGLFSLSPDGCERFTLFLGELKERLFSIRERFNIYLSEQDSAWQSLFLYIIQHYLKIQEYLINRGAYDVNAVWRDDQLLIVSNIHTNLLGLLVEVMKSITRLGLWTLAPKAMRLVHAVNTHLITDMLSYLLSIYDPGERDLYSLLVLYVKALVSANENNGLVKLFTSKYLHFYMETDTVAGLEDFRASDIPQFIISGKLSAGVPLVVYEIIQRIIQRGLVDLRKTSILDRILLLNIIDEYVLEGKEVDDDEEQGKGEDEEDTTIRGERIALDALQGIALNLVLGDAEKSRRCEKSKDLAAPISGQALVRPPILSVRSDIMNTIPLSEIIRDKLTAMRVIVKAGSSANDDNNNDGNPAPKMTMMSVRELRSAINRLVHQHGNAASNLTDIANLGSVVAEPAGTLLRINTPRYDQSAETPQGSFLVVPSGGQKISFMWDPLVSQSTINSNIGTSSNRENKANLFLRAVKNIGNGGTIGVLSQLLCPITHYDIPINVLNEENSSFRKLYDIIKLLKSKSDEHQFRDRCSPRRQHQRVPQSSGSISFDDIARSLFSTTTSEKEIPIPASIKYTGALMCPIGGCPRVAPTNKNVKIVQRLHAGQRTTTAASGIGFDPGNITLFVRSPTFKSSLGGLRPSRIGDDSDRLVERIRDRQRQRRPAAGDPATTIINDILQFILVDLSDILQTSMKILTPLIDGDLDIHIEEISTSVCEILAEAYRVSKDVNYAQTIYDRVKSDKAFISLTLDPVTNQPIVNVDSSSSQSIQRSLDLLPADSKRLLGDVNSPVSLNASTSTGGAIFLPVRPGSILTLEQTRDILELAIQNDLNESKQEFLVDHLKAVEELRMARENAIEVDGEDQSENPLVEKLERYIKNITQSRKLLSLVPYSVTVDHIHVVLRDVNDFDFYTKVPNFWRTLNYSSLIHMINYAFRLCLNFMGDPIGFSINTLTQINAALRTNTAVANVEELLA